MIALLIRWARSGLSSFFSSRVEDSFRLRTLTLAGLWVAAIGLTWIGGDLRYCLAAGVVGTAGHWFSYKMRYRPSRLRPVVIAVLVVALSVYMRNDMVKTFNGDWVPLGQYLVLVSGLAAFDVRTRGGLYTGLVLSGMVLFFASQQAFDYSFGVFVVGFVVVSLAFLVLSFLEDMIRTARVYWAKNSVATLAYWMGTICAMFLLAGLAFWVLPRGETNLIGPPQLAVLPYSENDIEIQKSLTQIEQENEPLTDMSVGDSPGRTAGAEELQGDGPETGSTPQTSMLTEEQAGGAESGNGSVTAGESGSGAARFGDRLRLNQAEPTAPVYSPDSGIDPAATSPETQAGQLQRPAVTARGIDRSESGEDPVVFYVRSKVASYWRGLVLEEYDRDQWFVTNLNNQMIESRNHEGTWYNKENDFSSDNFNYQQTFFLRGNDDLPMVTGYLALRVVTNNEQTDDSLLGSGTSYGVISMVPKHTPDDLRNDSSAGLSPFLAILPQDTEQELLDLAGKVVAGASSDFDKLGLIISYLNAETELVPPGTTGLTSVATLDEFLFQGVAGSILDYATATVMLARASRLPARLAVGYLPGVRDPLTGTYLVRESDRHAWAEVKFRQNGWVPFDGAPRGEFSFGQRPAGGLAKLFISSAGDDVYATLKQGPQEAFQTLMNSMPGPVLWGLAPAITIVLLIVRWFRTGSRRRLSGPGRRLLSYGVIPGEGRREIKKIYAEVERLIRRDSGTPRAGWQTAGHYASFASGRSPEIDSQLSWFTQTIWRAAYRSGDLHAGVVTEGRRRLALLKEAFKAYPSQKMSIQNR